MDRGAAPYVAVIGPSEAGPAERDVAYAVGYELAARSAVLVCGGLGGVMEAAARGARAASPPGMTVGILPGDDRRAGNSHLSVTVATGLGELRNGVLVNSCDTVIAVGGSPGTLVEMAYALRSGRPVVVLNGWSIRDAAGAPVDGITTVTSPAEAVAAALDQPPRSSR